jgi:hypothetical protein
MTRTSHVISCCRGRKDLLQVGEYSLNPVCRVRSSNTSRKCRCPTPYLESCSFSFRNTLCNAALSIALGSLTSCTLKFQRQLCLSSAEAQTLKQSHLFELLFHRTCFAQYITHRHLLFCFPPQTMLVTVDRWVKSLTQLALLILTV